MVCCATRPWRDGTGRPPALQKAMDKADLLEWYMNSGNIFNPAVIQELLGEGVGDIEGIKGAYKITLGIEQEATDTTDRLKSLHLNY